MALYPLSAYYTTTLTPRITSYELLADRILRQLGAPLINLEVACSTVFDHIGQAIEWYTKYAGHTQEYLIFNSKLYQTGLGIRLDQLFSITPETYKTELFITTTTTTTVSTSSVSGISVSSTVVALSSLTTTASAATFSATSSVNIDTTSSPTVSTVTTTEVTLTSGASAIYDYDLNSYRKVKAVTSFVEGTNKGVNTLFTIEQSLAQQTQFAYGLGNYGFDLVTWEIMKQWLEMRERVLALKVYYRFDPRTQYLRLLPEPNRDVSDYYALIECTVEKPIKDLIKERWVMQYALALTKITIANVRGKYGGTALFGGGMLNATDLMTQGIQEKEKLEQELMFQAGEADPVPFFIG